MLEPVLTEDERHVDACVLGTGLTESLIAAALARQGRRVLHLDRAEAYGGNWRALSLAELERWTNASPPEVPPALAEPVALPSPPGANDGVAPKATPAEAEDNSGAKAEAKGCGDVGVPDTEEVGAVQPLPDRDVSHLESVPLEPEPVHSCFSRRAGMWDPFSQRSEEELRELRTELMKRGGSAFSIDSVPRLLFGRSDVVDSLVESGVARYLEFQGLKSARVLTQNGLVSVPLTKSDIFKDPFLSLPEKRMLMKFITSMSPFVGSLAFESPAQLGVDQARKVPGPTEPVAPTTLEEGTDLTMPWSQFLEKQKLSPRLREFLTYAICLWDWAPEQGASGGVGELSTGEGLRCLGRFVSSLGLYGRGTSMPLLYPMYGAAEMAQGFTRMCALHRGTYALRTSITQLLVSRGDTHGNSSDEGPAVAGIVTQRGEVVWTRSVVASCDHLTQQGSTVAGVDGTASGEACKRMTVIMDCPLLSEDGLNLCVVPPSSMDPPLENVVQILQLDWTTGTCPRGYNVVHLSQATRKLPEAGADDDLVFGDLRRVLAGLLGYMEGGQRHCLFSCVYLHEPRGLVRWDRSTPAGQLLHACADSERGGGGGLVICADPVAAPQLLAGHEVTEARAIFLRTARLRCQRRRESGDVGHSETQDEADEAEDSADIEVGPDDFLKKPVHVALEENCSGMEELEHFNEEMLSAERGAAAPDSLAAAAASTGVDATEATADEEMLSAERGAGAPDSLAAAAASTGVVATEATADEDAACGVDVEAEAAPAQQA